MQNLSLFARLTSETPAFWKRVQIICLVLSVAVGYADNFHLLPSPVIGVLAGLFAGVSCIAQFAVKDQQILTNAITDPGSAIAELPDLIDQVKQIHAAVTNPPKVTIADLISAPATPAPATNTDQPASTPIVTQPASVSPFTIVT